MSTEQTLPFEFISESHPRGELRVLSVAATEEINEVYRARLELDCPADAGLLDALEAALLGKPAALLIAAGETRRRLQGVVSGLKIAGCDAERARFSLEIVPRLGLLAMRRRYRIFQDKTVQEIVKAVLDEWRVTHRFELGDKRDPRPYATQHGETDYAFVTRLLASEGIGFYFAASLPGAPLAEAPDVIFFDAATGYDGILGAEPGQHKPARGRGATALRYAANNAEYRDDDVLDFTFERGLSAKSALLGDFDFRRPQFGLFAGAGPAGNAIEKAEAFENAWFGEGSETNPAAGPIADARAGRALEALRRDAYVGRGRTCSGRILPGHVFALEGHPVDGLNAEYVVTRVEHRGRSPQAIDDKHEVYEASFTCVPATVAYRPPFERSLREVRGHETATVVGPSGEDLFTDVHGRVKVHFHWDRESKGDEHSSCWLRVAQSWAGSRWGMQFVPRVGMEVLVTFLGGDPDRPLVSGCLYNATHPTPFSLPGERYKSGLRTLSGDKNGHSELSFDDRAGEELLTMIAQKDLEVTVGGEHVLEVDGDERHKIRGSHELTVGGARLDKIGGALEQAIGGALTQNVRGDHELTIIGDHRGGVSGDAKSRIGGAVETQIDGRAQATLGSRGDLTLTDDGVLRVKGHLVAVVGEHDARKSATIHVEGSTELYGTGTTEIISEKAIVIRVGDTSVRIGPDTIEILSETLIVRSKNAFHLAEEKLEIVAKKEARVTSDKKVRLKAEKSSVQLDRNARVDGEMVKLNCMPDPIDPDAPEKKEIKKTTFSLVDDGGAPMAGQRFTLVMPDGSERSGVLDQDGKAELELEDSGDVLFPDVATPKPA